jgi:hypothetical protein
MPICTKKGCKKKWGLGFFAINKPFCASEGSVDENSCMALLALKKASSEMVS